MVVQRGLIPDSILAFAGGNAIDLIVMCTHGCQGLDRLTMWSVTEKVLRKARCPVLAVRKPSHDFVTSTRGRDSAQLDKILLCTDFSDYALHALGYGLSLAMEYNAQLTLLHVLEDVSTSDDLQAKTAQAISLLEKPIAEIGGEDARTSRPLELNTILFATDFLAASTAALPYVVAIARRYGAKVYLAHVVTPAAYPTLPSESMADAYEQLNRDAGGLLSEVSSSPTWSGIPARIPHPER